MDKEEVKKIAARIVARAWKDPEFKKRLLANPKATLTEIGYMVPANMNIKIHEETHNTHNIVLPSAPEYSRELSDTEIEKLSAAALGNASWCQCSVARDTCGR